MTMRTVIVGDTEYSVDKFYRDGVNACKQNVPWHCNPHRLGSMRHDQWNYGHENESAGDHEGMML